MVVLVEEEELLSDVISAVKVAGGWSGQCGHAWFGLRGCDLGMGGLLGMGAWGILDREWFGRLVGLVGWPWARRHCGLMGLPQGGDLSVGLEGLHLGLDVGLKGRRRGSCWSVW